MDRLFLDANVHFSAAYRENSAIAAEASRLITGDRKDFGPYFGQKLAGVWVMTPREYLSGRGS